MMRERGGQLGAMVMEGSAATSATASPSIRGYAVYATIILFATNLIAYIDRQILSLLVQPIKASLHVSDGQIGLIQGMAFVATYSLAGLVIGRLVDQFNRRNLLIAAVVIWSISVALGGFAQSGVQLFVARMGVGLGEATLIPCVVSLFADYFDPHHRGRAYGIFVTGVYAGSGLSLLLVASALSTLERMSTWLAANGHPFEPWRIVMVGMMIPGLICVAFLTTIREPVRRHIRPVDGTVAWQGIKDWLAQSRLLLPHHLGFSCLSLTNYAVVGWLPTVLIREYGMPTRNAGYQFGVAVLAAGVLGTLVGGILSDWSMRRHGMRSQFLTAISCSAVSVAAFGLTGLIRSRELLLLASAISIFCVGIALVIGVLTMAAISPARSRGQITGIYFVFSGLIGAAGGPALVGFLNDAAGGTSLSAIVRWTGGVAGLGAIALIGLTMRRAEEEVGFEY